MSEVSRAITRIDTDDYRPLRELLEEYHEWMAKKAHRAGESSDADTSVAGDLRDVKGRSETPCSAWLAVHGTDSAGCALLYGVADDMAELKRLYVRPSHRNHGIGRALTKTTIEAATECGYTTLALTTPPWSHAAHALYDALGFERTEPYPETRLPKQYHDDAIFMQYELTG
jgi:GNAT superfamily N-acetyltransferase